MCNKNYIWIIIYCLLGFSSMGVMSGCAEDENECPGKNHIAIPLAINSSRGNLLSALSFDNSSYAVNRILILPFRKSSESATDDDENFIPDFTQAKQFDVHWFPAYANMLDLTEGSSYQVMVIGYHQDDYDMSDPTAAGTRFAIDPASNPTLDNIQLSLASPVSTPELFVGTCGALLNRASIGNIFVAQQGVQLSGSLERIVSGLSFEITNVPNFVDSVSLVAEQLVTAVKVKDATATVWQTAGDSGDKLLDTQLPANGTISFNTYLLPTFDERKTRLFLDVYFYGETERYTVNVNDVAGTSSSGFITFSPNRAVNITGDYADMNVGFVVDNGINLDEDEWDGLN